MSWGLSSVKFAVRFQINIFLSRRGPGLRTNNPSPRLLEVSWSSADLPCLAETHPRFITDRQRTPARSGPHHEEPATIGSGGPARDPLRIPVDPWCEIPYSPFLRLSGLRFEVCRDPPGDRHELRTAVDKKGPIHALRAARPSNPSRDTTDTPRAPWRPRAAVSRTQEEERQQHAGPGIEECQLRA